MKNICHFLGELIGTFILVFFGCGAVAVTVLFASHVGLFQVAVIWGFAVTLAIYVTRHLSCAHINPSVSLAMVISKRMSPKSLAVYWAGQFTGAFLAAAVLYGIFSSSIAEYEASHAITRGATDSAKTAMIFGEFYPNPSLPNLVPVSMTGAFLAEAFGTFLLVFLVLSLTKGCNVGRPDDGLSPVFIGMSVTAIISIIAPLTQAGLNPARDLSPRIFAYLAGWGKATFPDAKGGLLTVYVLGPFAGAVCASLFFSWILQPLMAHRKQTSELKS